MRAVHSCNSWFSIIILTLKKCLVAACGTDEFQCVNGLCLPPELVCDGRYDCIGGEDEHCTSKIIDSVVYWSLFNPFLP